VASATNDPAAVFLTVALAELILAAGHAPGWEVFGTLASQRPNSTCRPTASPVSSTSTTLTSNISLPSRG
jgi:hypothetical protein